MKFNRFLWIAATVLFWQSCIPFNPIDLPGSSQVPPCDQQVPIVFAHGNQASGDTYSLQIQRFEQNGYCPDRLFAFDWNTLGVEASAQKLAQLILEVRRETGAEKVHLVGHSAGSFLGYRFLKQQVRADLVDKYVHIGGSGYGNPAGPPGNYLPTLNIWSTYDFVVTGGNIPGAINVMYTEQDHLEVATSAESFEAMYMFFTGMPPSTTELQPSEELIISGKAVSFGENIPGTGGNVEIYAVDPATGNRLSETPDAIFDVEEFGFWGPFEAQPGTYYEFLVYANQPGDRPIHYYTEPFIRSNRHLYLRTYPPANSLATLLLGIIPSDDDQSISAAFSANRSVIAGRDMLLANGVDIATEEVAAAELFTVAVFLYDENDNGASELTSVPEFESLSIGALDFFQPPNDGFTEYVFNGRALRMPNRPSFTDGVNVAIFQ
jgi:pimeloyl-ACP methyl ester carboxylesterase